MCTDDVECAENGFRRPRARRHDKDFLHWMFTEKLSFSDVVDEREVRMPVFGGGHSHNWLVQYSRLTCVPSVPVPQKPYVLRPLDMDQPIPPASFPDEESRYPSNGR